MIISYLSLWGAFAMLIIGVIAFAILRLFLYRLLRDRHERLKVTGKTGLSPIVIWGWLRFFHFLVLPAFGFLIGHAVISPWLSS